MMRTNSHNAKSCDIAEASARRLPDFIAVGPPRTASTWLYTVLRIHAVFPRGVKETHFFSMNYPRGLDWYRRFFPERGSVPLGETCTSYFASARARERIREHIPDCRIICTLRDPVQRLYSHYKLMVRRGTTNGSFERALCEHRTMIEASRYGRHLAAWRVLFGDNVLVLLNDDLESDPQAYLDRVAEFIGIGSVSAPAAHSERVHTIERAPRSIWMARGARRLKKFLKVHHLCRVRGAIERAGIFRFCQGGGAEFPKELNPALGAELRREFLADIEALESLLQRDLSAWKRPPPAQRNAREYGSGEPGALRSAARR